MKHDEFPSPRLSGSPLDSQPHGPTLPVPSSTIPIRSRQEDQRPSRSVTPRWTVCKARLSSVVFEPVRVACPNYGSPRSPAEYLLLRNGHQFVLIGCLILSAALIIHAGAT